MISFRFQYDWAVLSLGNVANLGTDTSAPDTSLLTIEWDVLMVDRSQTHLDGHVYWVSAGAEYNGDKNLWVGQHSLVMKYICSSAVSIVIILFYLLLLSPRQKR